MYEIIKEDCREVMAAMPADSIDAIVTDPPYGLSFMCRGWDHEVPGPDYWTAAIRVAKPGAFLLAFGGTRKWHRLACAIEDSGWKLRDSLQWLYGSGFPKSHNVDEIYRSEKPGFFIYYEGGTALKPAWEPIILARKPLDGSVADNVLKWGTGVLNIDATRIGTSATDAAAMERCNTPGSGRFQKQKDGCAYLRQTPSAPLDTTRGRWPANLILDEESAAMLDQQSGESRSIQSVNHDKSESLSMVIAGGPYKRGASHTDSGGASRFFYTAKASRSEREAGLDGERQIVNDGRAKPIDNPYLRGKTKRRNLHPTVKPLDLMRWLVRLVTPPGGRTLDPFCGSGSTVAAALMEGFDAIGIDIDQQSVDIATKRAAFAKVQAGTATARDAEKLAGPVQLGLLGLEKG